MMNKTFAEIAPTIVYPEMIPDALQAALYEWYQYREVADDERFATWYIRHLTHDYGRYDQILRIEAGVSTYDWLVQHYRESQSYAHGIGETSGTSGGVTTAIAATSTNASDVDNMERTGRSFDDRSDAHTLSRTGESTDNTDRATTSMDDGASSSTKITSGGHTDTDIRYPGGTYQTDTQTVDGDDSTHETVGWDTTNRKRLEKTNPMSISYTTGIAEPIPGTTGVGEGASSGGILDWSAPSAQAADMGRDGHGEHTTDHVGHTRTVSTLATEDKATHEVVYDDQQDVVDTTDHATRSGVESVASRGATQSDDVYQGVGSASHTYTDDSKRTISRIGGSETAGTQTTDGSTSGTSEDERLVQQIYTGRSEDIATLLSRAATYIMTTDAFDWLRRRLDVCFMGVYNI